MKKLLLLILLPLLCFSATKEEVLKLFKKRFPKQTISVREFKYKPYYVVEVDGSVFLFDPNNNLVFLRAFSLNKRGDLLKPYREELVRKSLSKVDLTNFIHYTKSPKKGAQRVLLFSDPMCPHCKRAFKFLKGLADNGTVDLYIGFIPVHGNAKQVQGILCSKDPASTYAEIVEGKKVKLTSCSNGTSEFFKQLIWAQKLGFRKVWRGVPAVFFLDKKQMVIGANLRRIAALLGVPYKEPTGGKK